MKILLVLPAGDHLRVTAESPRVPRRAMLRFSVLPLTVVAALTPERHQTRIVDENVQPLDLDAPADLVGISFMTALAPRAYHLAREFRARGRTVVAGGYHPTLMPEETARWFDAVVVGDAEGLWPRLLEDAEAGRLRSTYRAETPPDPALTPPSRRDLLAGQARHYATTAAVQVGRGCRHACRYCSVAAFHGGRLRHRPLTPVLAELAALPRDFIFVDDNLGADRLYAIKLFEGMAPLRKRWVGQCAIGIARDPELLARARAAGCRGLFIGLETLSPANLAAMGKEFNRAQEYRADVARLHRQGIGVIAGIMVGLDGDDPGVFRRTLRFLAGARVDAVQVNILTPLPGTPLFRDLDREGRIVDRDWSRYDFRHVVFRPARMTAAELQDGADWLYREFYRLDRIIMRTIRAAATTGFVPAVLAWRLGLTYRYDNLREGIRGRDPARAAAPAMPLPAAAPGPA